MACLFSYNDSRNVILGGQAMVEEAIPAYEKMYFEIWELAQRYQGFTAFRVIGSSHDQRMIPMLEIGRGEQVLFCLSGLCGTWQEIPLLLNRMAKEYCQAYEFGWMLEDFYPVRLLLDQFRICLIPLLNPDGYEIRKKGLSGIRNPVSRQMLAMQQIAVKSFSANARSVDLRRNFPTTGCRKKCLGQQPGSENETKALMRILQEYPSIGLLSFTENPLKKNTGKMEYLFSYHQKTVRMARHLQKYAGKENIRIRPGTSGRRHLILPPGSPEQYYAEKIRRPSLQVVLPPARSNSKDEKRYREIRLLPLEYLFALTS
jgi:g-D-glutamyl-meso-diaminopimelate peptidase